MERLRVITNYLTRMRYCSEEGWLDLEEQRGQPQRGHRRRFPPGLVTPIARPKRTKILFGHWASLEGMTDSPNAIGLDTGCVWDGAMSLYCLETEEWARCKCKDGKCKE